MGMLMHVTVKCEATVLQLRHFEVRRLLWIDAMQYVSFKRTLLKEIVESV